MRVAPLRLGIAGQGRLAGLGMDADVEVATDPGPEAVVELVEAGDADLLRFEEEAFPDDPVEAFLLASALWCIWSGMDEPDAQDRAASREFGAAVCAAVVHV